MTREDKNTRSEVHNRVWSCFLDIRIFSTARVFSRVSRYLAIFFFLFSLLRALLTSALLTISLQVRNDYGVFNKVFKEIPVNVFSVRFPLRVPCCMLVGEGVET